MLITPVHINIHTSRRQMYNLVGEVISKKKNIPTVAKIIRMHTISIDVKPAVVSCLTNMLNIPQNTPAIMTSIDAFLSILLFLTSILLIKPFLSFLQETEGLFKEKHIFFSTNHHIPGCSNVSKDLIIRCVISKILHKIRCIPVTTIED